MFTPSEGHHQVRSSSPKWMSARARGEVPDGEDTEIGLNLPVGDKFVLASLTPFAELRVEAGGGEQVVLTGGLLFP